MPFSKYSPKQKKLAALAPPRKKITKAGRTAQDNFIKHGIRNIDDLDKNSRTYRRLVKKGKNKSV